MARTGRPRTVFLPMDELRELAAQGWCLRELAARYGCSRDLVMNRMREAGIPRLPAWSHPGTRNPAWKGGRYLVKGYVMVWAPDHPQATKNGRVAEHRLVMEQALGRFLAPTEVVHHKNRDRADNRPENLELFASNGSHLRAELSGRKPNWTEAGTQRIREAARRPKALISGASHGVSGDDDVPMPLSGDQKAT